MKKLELGQMENINGSGNGEDIAVGISCGLTILLLATPAAPFALATGNLCLVGLIGYGLGKY